MDVGPDQLRAMDRQGAQQMPVLEARKGGGVVILLESLGQGIDLGLIKGLELLGRDQGRRGS